MSEIIPQALITRPSDSSKTRGEKGTGSARSVRLSREAKRGARKAG